MHKYIYEFIAEFIGTFVILLIALKYKNGIIIGLSLGLVIFIGEKFYKASVNPVFTSIHYLSGYIDNHELKLFIIAQILGGLSAFFIYDKYFKKNKIYIYE